MERYTVIFKNNQITALAPIYVIYISAKKMILNS